MSSIEICYMFRLLWTQTVVRNIPGFQGLKKFIQHLSTQPHKRIFYPSNSYDGSDVIILTCTVNKV